MSRDSYWAEHRLDTWHTPDRRREWSEDEWPAATTCPVKITLYAAPPQSVQWYCQHCGAWGTKVRDESGISREPLWRGYDHVRTHHPLVWARYLERPGAGMPAWEPPAPAAVPAPIPDTEQEGLW